MTFFSSAFLEEWRRGPDDEARWSNPNYQFTIPRISRKSFKVHEEKYCIQNLMETATFKTISVWFSMKFDPRSRWFSSVSSQSCRSQRTGSELFGNRFAQKKNLTWGTFSSHDLYLFFLVISFTSSSSSKCFIYLFIHFFLVIHLC